MKEESKKVGLNLNIQKTKIMASDPIILWQTEGEIVEGVTDIIFFGSKITADGDCSHEIKRHLLVGRKIMTNLDSILKSRDITLPTKVHIVKVIVFPIVMYGCEFSSVQLLNCVRLFATPWNAAHQASLSITNSQSPPKPTSIESVMPSNHLILCRPLLLLPSVFPSIRVFSNESALHIKWPKYWSFSFNISPSNALQRKLSAEELVFLNCGIGKDSWDSLRLQGDPTSPS